MKFGIVAAVITVLCITAGCGTVNEYSIPEATLESGKSKSNELHVQRAGTPDSIDPALAATSDELTMIYHLSEGLLSTDENNRIIPGAAESFDVSDDGLTYTFHLRDNLKWSDGTSFTAEDFVYTWKRAVDPKTASPYAAELLNYVKGFEEASRPDAPDLDKLCVSAPDPVTFTVELSRPCAFFDKICAFGSLMPVQKRMVEKNDQWALTPETYITNGAYKLTEYTPGEAIVMEKNENYWDSEHITFDKIVWHLIEDNNASYTAYIGDTLDFCFGVPSEEIPALKNDSELHIEPQMGIYFLDFNNEREPFTDGRVRKALSMVIDRDYVANTIMLGLYSPARNLIGPGVSDADPGSLFEEVTDRKYKDHFRTEEYSANVEQAKKLLSEAGYPGGEGFPTFRYTTNDDGFHKAVAEYLQYVWKETLGIECVIEIQEWNTFVSDGYSGNFDVTRNNWVFDWDDPSNFIDLFETGGGNNDCRFSSEGFDSLIDTAKKTIDRKERFNLLHQAEQIILNENPVIPIAYCNDYWLQKSNLKGIWHLPNGSFCFKYGYKE